jgi:FkbM family methyltransferase
MDEDFDLRDLSNAPIAEVPWFFRLGKYLARHKIRGGDRLLAEARRRGMLNQLAIYSLGDVELRVPLWRPCNQWSFEDVRDYEAAFMRSLARATAQLEGDVTLIDCGADIGTVTAHLVSRCKNIKRVFAFEPNAAAFGVLRRNLAAMRVVADARHAAVADFSGRGRLVQASQDPSAHAMYVAPDESGPIAVQCIDDLGVRDATCVIKIDVEGTEASVVAGAAETIRCAREVIVAFEAHPKVAKRLGRDPIEVVEALLAIREVAFEVDKAPDIRLDPRKRIFDQLPPTRVYNVIATARS